MAQTGYVRGVVGDLVVPDYYDAPNESEGQAESQDMRDPLEQLGIQELWNEADWGLAIVAADGRWVRVNPRLEAILEYTEAELQDMTFADITVMKDRKYDLKMAEEVRLGKRRSYKMWKAYITKNGRIIDILLKVTAVRQPDGTFINFFSQISPPIKKGDPAALDGDGEVKATKATLLAAFVTENWKLIGAIVMALLWGIMLFVQMLLSMGETDPGQLEKMREMLEALQNSGGE